MAVKKNDVSEIAALRAQLAEIEEKLNGAVEGFCICTNTACESFDELKELAVRLDRTEMRNGDGIVERTSEYIVPVDDADLDCPDCGTSRFPMLERPKTYPKIAGV